MKTWTKGKFEQLCALAATGAYASEIATALGTSHASILTMAGRNGVAVNRYTPAEQDAMDKRAREAEARKNAKRRKKNAAQRPDKAAPVQLHSQNKTSAGYRNCLPKMPEMTKGELRAMLAEAVRNTAGATA